MIQIIGLNEISKVCAMHQLGPGYNQIEIIYLKII